METNTLQLLSSIENQLRQFDQPLTSTEASKYLNLSKSTLFKFTSKNKLPFYKPNGKKIYFLKKDLDNWILRRRLKSVDEIEQAVINDIQFGVKNANK